MEGLNQDPGMSEKNPDKHVASYDNVMAYLKEQSLKMDRILLFVETLGKQVKTLEASNSEMKALLNAIKSANPGNIRSAITTPHNLIKRELGFDVSHQKDNKFDSTLFYEISDDTDEDKDDMDNDDIEVVKVKSKSKISNKAPKKVPPKFTKEGLRSSSKAKRVVSRTPLSKSPAKKVFRTSSHTQAGSLKRQKVEPQSSVASPQSSNIPLKSAKISTVTQSLDAAQNVDPTIELPENLRGTVFPVPANMKLSALDQCIAVILFGAHMEASELIFRRKNRSFKRWQFQNMLLERPISTELVELMSLKMTWDQRVSTSAATTWSLPPSFAEDVINNIQMQIIVEKYTEDWLIHSNALQQIYVSVYDLGAGHWFLIVVSFKHQKVSCFESFKAPTFLLDRMYQAHLLTNTINLLLPKLRSSIDGSPIDVDIKDWPLSNPQGLVESGHSADSAFWVLEWLHMEDTFQDFSVGKIDEEQVIMRTALTLAKSKANLLWTKLEGDTTMLLSKYTS